jgi:hypothetical protein
MAYQVRNRFINADSQTAIQGPGPIRMQSTGPTPPDPRTAPVTGSGPGYAAANIGENRFLPNGKAMLSANDPDAPRLYAKNPGMYELPPGMNPNGSTAAQNRHLGAAMGPNPFQMEQRPIAMAKGGIINEPIVGRGQRTGRQYLMGEAGPEVVSPMDANGEQSFENDGGQFSDEMIEMLQKVLGRRIFKPGRRSPLKRHGMHRAMTENTTRGVNAPVIRISDEEVRMIANRPELRPMLNVLIQAEKRGGVQITDRSGQNVFTQGPNGEISTVPIGQPQNAPGDMGPGGNQFDPGIESVPEDMGFPTQYTDPNAGGYASQHDYSQGDPTPPTQYDDPSAPYYASQYDYSQGDPTSYHQSDLSDPFGDPRGQMPSPDVYSSAPTAPTQYTDSSAPSYASPIDYSQGDAATTAAPQYPYATPITPMDMAPTSWSGSDPNPTNTSQIPYASQNDYSQGDTASIPNAAGYTVAPTQTITPDQYSTNPIPGRIAADAPYEQVQTTAPRETIQTNRDINLGGGGIQSPSTVTQQAFSQEQLDKMLADTLARVNYQPGGGTASFDQGEIAAPQQIIPGYSSTSISFDPGIVETDAERMMRIASSGGTSTGRLQ